MFTESYIEKVINNKQIQNLCKYREGDWFYYNGVYPSEDEKFPICVVSSDDFETVKKGYYKWLPTLEDLFGIAKPILDEKVFEIRITVIKGNWEILIGIADYKNKCIDVKKYGKNIKESLLKMIMAYKYNKSWNPEKKEWEEINGS